MSIVGPGRAARALARSWILAGGRLADVISRTESRAQEAVEAIAGGRPRSLTGGPFACDVLIVGTPDDAIRDVAGQLAGRLSCRVAFHLSGALGARELDPLSGGGVSLASLHPVRAFSGVLDESWGGAFVAIEGDEDAVLAGEQIARAVHAHSHRVPAPRKALYHAAATLAAGGSVALVSLASRLWSEVGIPEPDARAALADLSARASGAAVARPFDEVFTGPVARRDLGTVRAHRSALSSFPEALALYAALARETLRRTPGLGKEEEILAVLEGRNS